MQPPVSHPPRDRVIVESARAQLTDRHDAVPLGGQACDARVGGWAVLLSSGATRTDHPVALDATARGRRPVARGAMVRDARVVGWAACGHAPIVPRAA